MPWPGRTTRRGAATEEKAAEAKELAGGFAIIQVKSKGEAIEWTKRFLRVAGDGESELRLLHEASDFAPAEAQRA